MDAIPLAPTQLADAGSAAEPRMTGAAEMSALESHDVAVDAPSVVDALPRAPKEPAGSIRVHGKFFFAGEAKHFVKGVTYGPRSEEHTSELQSPYVISYAVFCLKKKIK